MEKALALFARPCEVRLTPPVHRAEGHGGTAMLGVILVVKRYLTTEHIEKENRMAMKFKADVEPTATCDFWYDLFEGGYLKPARFLEDPEEAKRIEEARKLLMEYKCELMDSGLVEDM